MSHTPGPWNWDDTVWDYDPAEQAPWLVAGADQAAVVLGGEIKCNEANARLIAAAPDLLAAAEMELALSDLEDEYNAKLDAGEDSMHLPYPFEADEWEAAKAAMRAAVKKARGAA